MDATLTSFWVLFALIVFGLLITIIFFSASFLQKKRIERRLDQVFFEVRELNLRVVVVETRMEERTSVTPSPAQPIAEITTKPARRGRPKKVTAEK